MGSLMIPGRAASAALGLTIVAATALGGAAFAQQDAPVTLRLALADDMGRPSWPYVTAFVEAARELSDGAVTIEVIPEAGRDSGLGSERGTAQLLVDGEAELALVAARAWEHVGIPDLRVLQAPFLIDDDALAVAVAESAVATALLDAMSEGGVTGLALWPEDLRHPVAFDRCTAPLVSPEAFAGLTIRALDSTITFALLEALGATPTSGEYDDACTISGAESGLRQGQALPLLGTFTGDVTFFPKYQVLTANTAAFDRLPDTQQGVVRDAAAVAQQRALAEHPTDAEAALEWCAAGGGVVDAGPAGIAAFVAAAQPVYDALAADAATAELIAAIGEFKSSVTPSAGAQACAPRAEATESSLAAAGVSPIDGTYVTSITHDELVGYQDLLDQGEINDGNWGDITLTFDSGEMTIDQRNVRTDYTSSGTYEVEADVLELFDPNACCPVEPYGFGWSLDGDTLTLTRIDGQVGPSMFVIKPWTRVSE